MVRLQFLRDAVVWRAGEGPATLERSTLLEGQLLTRNPLTRQLVLHTDRGVLKINAEDVRELGPAYGLAS